LREEIESSNEFGNQLTLVTATYKRNPHLFLLPVSSRPARLPGLVDAAGRRARRRRPPRSTPPPAAAVASCRGCCRRRRERV